MRPGHLNGIGNYWFGNTKSKPKAKAKKAKTLHPDIYKFSGNHLDIAARRGKLKVKEVAEQIYRFDLFTPEFCKKLIEEAEFQGGWSTGIDQEDSFSGFGMMKLDPSLFKSLRTENEMDTTFSLKDFPVLPGGKSLTKTINDTTKKLVAPVIGKLWKSFEVEKFDQP
jgi:tRNA G37 N-methylase TrmD